MAGIRFSTPFDQFLNSAGAPYAGGSLSFYATNSSTPQATYSDYSLAAQYINSNPLTLDSAGRLPTAVFLQALAYKVVLADSLGNQIWTSDPVYNSDYIAYARVQTFAGNPNGSVAGTAASGSGSTQIPADVVYDRTNNALYVCTSTGTTTTAVWTNPAASALTGAVVLSGAITPTALAIDTNNWAPTSFSSAYHVRMSASSAVALTGIAGGAAGREILLSNVGSNDVTMSGNSGSSSAGNKFLMNDVLLGAGRSIVLYYDGTSAGWRAKSTVATGKETIWIPAGAMTSRATNGSASGSVEMGSNKNMFITKDYNTTTQQFSQFFVRFPKSWNLGTVTFIPVWSHTGGANFGVVWGLAGVGVPDSTTGDVAFGTAITSTDTGGTNNVIYIGPESAVVTIAGTLAQGVPVWFQVNRTVADGGDTLTVDARLHGITLIYQINNTNDA